MAPVQVAAIVIHGVGGAGLILSNKSRLVAQKESRTNTGLKLALTIAAAGTTLWSGLVGAKMAKHASEGADGTTEPTASSSDDLAKAQRQQKILQRATPVLTDVLTILGAQQGEQQRPLAGLLKRR